MKDKKLYFRSEYPFTMKDVEETRNDLLQTSNDLLCMVNEENYLELQQAGANICVVINNFLDNLTDEPSEEENLAEDFRKLAEKYGFEKKGGEA